MFLGLLTKLRQQVDTIRRSVETNDEIRSLLAGTIEGIPLSSLISMSPSITEWRIYDHCAALTRLYAVYENFVEEIVTDFLSILPSLYKYSDLGNSFHKEHRNGIANVLQKLGGYRYRNLSSDQVVKDFYDAISDVEAYVILPQTLLRYEQNLRMNILDILLNRVGIQGIKSWISNHRLSENFIRDVRGGQNTIDAELTSFIDYRNDAAHGNVVNVLGKEALLEYCSFIEVLCEALYERINHYVITRRLELGTAKEVGAVTEVYRDNIIVAKIYDMTSEIGDELLFIGNKYCYTATIENIQVDDVDQNSVIVTNEKEIGFKMDVLIKPEARIISDATTVEDRQISP
jgi:hypothetical protein